MKRPHLCWVHEPVASFRRLIEAGARRHMRIGWLQLAEVLPVPGLEEAAALGVLRAVAVGAGRSVAIKRGRGQLVLHDLLREYFLGAQLVLILGDPKRPGVRLGDGDGRLRLWGIRGPVVPERSATNKRNPEAPVLFKLVASEGPSRVLDSEALADRLRRARLL